MPSEADQLTWLTNMMWADLRFLSTLKPFNSQNLLSHLTSNQERWSKLYKRRDKPITFEDLPNKDQLDLRFFSKLDGDELLEDAEQLLPPGEQPSDTRSQ